MSSLTRRFVIFLTGAILATIVGALFLSFADDTGVSFRTIIRALGYVMAALGGTLLAQLVIAVWIPIDKIKPAVAPATATI